MNLFDEFFLTDFFDNFFINFFYRLVLVMETVAVLLSNVYLVHLEADPILNNNILLPLALIVQ